MSAVEPSYTLSRKFIIVCFIPLAILTVIAWDGLSLLASRWYNDEAYSHGFIMLLVIGYFLYQERENFRRDRHTQSWIGFSCFVLAVCLLLLAHVTQIQTLLFQAYLVSIGFLLIAIMGRASLRALLPLSLIFFAVPLPYFTQVALTADLQLLSTSLAADALRLFRVPVFIEGNIIDLGDIQLQVVEACAGLNYMVPLLGLGHIFAYLYKSALWKRIFLIVSTVPISIVLNSARIAITGVLVDRYGTQLAEGFFHAFQGWLIFMISTGILCVELLILNRIGGKRIDLVTMFRDAYDAVSINVRKGDAVQRHIPNTLIGALVVTSVTGMVTLVMETRDEYIPERPPFAIFPDTIGPWTGNRLFGIADQMASIGADDYLLSNYRKDSTPGLVELYIAYFDKQTDDKNPHSPKACIPGGGWEISSITRVEKSIGRGRSIMVNKMLIQRGVNQQLLYYWFNLHGRNIADEYKMKAYLLKDRVLLSRTDGALIRIASLRKDGESLEMVENRLDSFLVSMDPVIDQFIPAI